MLGKYEFVFENSLVSSLVLPIYFSQGCFLLWIVILVLWIIVLVRSIKVLKRNYNKSSSQGSLSQLQAEMS